MTTYVNYPNGRSIANAGGNGLYAGTPVRTCLSGVFDSALQNLASTDSATVLTIPKGTWVEAVLLTILTPETTGSSTISVGDAGGTSSWVSAVDSTAVAGTTYLGAGAYAIATGTSATNGKLYTSDTALNLYADSGKVATTLKVRVDVFCLLV